LIDTDPGVQVNVFKIFTLAAVVCAAVVFAGTAAAATPLHGRSSIVVTSNVVVGTRAAGPNLLVAAVITLSLTGAFTGTSTVNYAGLQHADGSGVFHGTGTFTGTVAGCGSVTMPFSVVFSVSPAGDLVSRSGSLGRSPVVYQGSGSGSLLAPSLTEDFTYHC
jgi:hypothetical protein